MQVTFDPSDLRPLIEAVAAEMLERFDDGRIAWTEPEAAPLVGVKRHVLRDARLRGEIEHGKIGAKIVYSRRQLLAFVEGRVESQGDD